MLPRICLTLLEVQTMSAFLLVAYVSEHPHWPLVLHINQVNQIYLYAILHILKDTAVHVFDVAGLPRDFQKHW